ncbi:diguanylate cyclase [Deinococcus sp. HMF7620]|uniref:Diguanylate cyclase n=1 Tax=Deinococcus arboris TaxID=2682977 RepID=A0A7C9HRT4_9DEIO|nr:diguanylate cyclase [Deinococcus arboris]MVN87254.1 diguanylate cyclase [Deinococcus arboris]
MSALAPAPQQPLTLLEDAWSLRDTAPDLARQMAQTDGRFVDGHPSPEAGVLLAYLNWRAGHLSRAVSQVGTALLDLRAQAAGPWLMRALNLLAALHSRLGQRDQAAALYEEQLGLSRVVGDPECTAIAQHDLGVTLRASDPVRARAHVAGALETFQALGNLYAAAVAQLHLVRFDREAGDLSAAQTTLEQVLACPLLGQHPALAAAAYAEELTVARVLDHPERVKRARRHLRELCAAHDHPELHITAALALSVGAQPAAALAVLTPAVAAARALGANGSLPTLLERVAEAQAALGQHQDAVASLCEVLTLERELHHAERRQGFRMLDVLHRFHHLEAAAQEQQRYTAELQAHLRDLQTLNARIRELSRIDGLTRLHNRDYLFQEGGRLAELCSAQAPLSAAMLDIDHFKWVNDTWGHQLGDAVLQRLAQMLRAVAEPGDIVARYGGEEFVMLRPGRQDALRASCQALQGAVRDHAWGELRPGLRVTLSIGVAHTEANDFDALLGEADRRLYRVKSSGRNAICAAD